MEKRNLAEVHEMVNLTPHPINFVNEQGEVYLTIPSSGFLRAIENLTETDWTVDHNGVEVPCYNKYFGEIDEIPPEHEGKTIIVSHITAQAHKDKFGEGGVFIPHNMVRGEQGNIIGCRGLAMLVK